MSYRDKLYKTYSSNHTKKLYGNVSKKDLDRQVPILRSYFRKLFPLDHNVSILDIGCGNGGFMYWLKKEGFKNVQGVDISKEQIEEAKRLGINEVEQGELKGFLEKKENAYDVIIARDVLEHIPKDEVPLVLEKIAHALKKGGIFIGQTVNAKNILWGRLRHGDFTHEIAFTEESVEQLLKVSGYKNIECYPMKPVVHGVKSGIRFALWKLFEGCIRVYIGAETGNTRGIFTQNLIVKATK